MIKVAIAEDHQSFADGINLLLSQEASISVVGTACNGKDLLALVSKHQPDVVISDIKMPVMDGISSCKTIKEQHPNIKVIMFSMFEQKAAIKSCLEAGADAYLFKSASLQTLLEAIQVVCSGKSYFSKGIDQEDLQSVSSKDSENILSRSEIQILQLIAHGKTSSEIAAIRSSAVSTVEKHRKNMIHKLGLSGKNELLRYALECKYDFSL
ncbi:MAG: response regulator transcription factor [Flavobacteriaceae bacterium]|nr:response regulator transcription factor [Flavobacteriaceae bacterium]